MENLLINISCFFICMNIEHKKVLLLLITKQFISQCSLLICFRKTLFLKTFNVASACHGLYIFVLQNNP